MIISYLLLYSSLAREQTAVNMLLNLGGTSPIFKDAIYLTAAD
jgi:hypothetical protein